MDYYVAIKNECEISGFTDEDLEAIQLNEEKCRKLCFYGAIFIKRGQK